MARLNHCAYDILAAEVKRLVQDPLEFVRRDVVLRRLDKLRSQPGTPLTAEEMKAEVIDIFPEFDDKILQRAAKANRPAGKWGWVGAAIAGTALAAGGLWVLNLPYPMIRWPVARTAPILLLPSYLRMDHNYRQAIALVEQADQLVNRATSAQDIALGDDKAAQAQQHLDKLPVWFLGYYPRTYCTLFSCSWRFTYDEFESARKNVARMDAIVFQEENALQLLTEGTTAVDTAKQQYQTAAETQAKMQAAAAWQAGMDMLNEIPSDTLAGRMGNTKLEGYRRDFKQISGTLAGGNRSASLIEAAKQFAWTASSEGQGAPHPAIAWDRIAGLWQEAISRLEQVPLEDAGYAEAQTMLAEYQNKLGYVQEQKEREARSQQAFETAQRKSAELWGQVDAMNTAQYAKRLQNILVDLSQVEPGTTKYASAQELTTQVRSRLENTAE